MKYNALLDHYPIISSQIQRPALSVVLRELEHVLLREVPGDIAEFGCYVGTTTLFMRRLLDAYQLSERKGLYAYDSFVGLPPKTAADQSTAGLQFQGGALSITKREFLQTFRRAHLQPPFTHKAWFSDLAETQLPEQLSFAFLDGDFYESIIDSLQLSWPRLSPGGTLTIDDYQREALPGVTVAVRDFFGGEPASLRHEHNIAIIKKQ